MRTAAPSATLSVTVWQQYTRTGGCGVRMSANTARAPYWVRSHARRHQAELRKKGLFFDSETGQYLMDKA